MCTISGWIADPPLPRRVARSLCRALLYYGRDRGKHSAGIYLSTGKLLKAAEDADTFVGRPALMGLFDRPISHALMHNRQPTSGGTGDEQAQPFRHNDTITIHNGMVSNSVALAKEWGLTKHAGVDSEIITAFVEAYGINQLPKFMEATTGSSACAIITKGKLYLLRDNNPTSHIVLTVPGGHTITVFASTKDILESALKYVWFMPSSLTAIYTPSEVLHLVEPNGLTEQGRMKIKSWSTVGYESGCEGWRGRSYTPPGATTYRPGTAIVESSRQDFLSELNGWRWRKISKHKYDWVWTGPDRPPNKKPSWNGVAESNVIVVPSSPTGDIALAQHFDGIGEDV